MQRISLLSNIQFRVQIFHTSYQAYKKSAQLNIDQSTVEALDPIKKQTLSQLHKRFQCSIEEASSLYDILKFPNQNMYDIGLKKAWLRRKGGSLLVIRVNSEILLYTSGELNCYTTTNACANVKSPFSVQKIYKIVSMH